MTSNSDAQRSFFVFVTDTNTGKVKRVAVPADIQIGLVDNPASLDLMGRLALSAKDYTSTTQNQGRLNVSEHDTIVSVFNESSTPVTLSLSPSPRQGQVHFVKDASGVASTFPIALSSDSLIDGEESLQIGSDYGTAAIYWHKNSWRVLLAGSGSSGGDTTIIVSGSTPAVVQLTSSYLTVNAESVLPNSRRLQAGTGILFGDGGAGSTFGVSINDNIVATLSGALFSGPVIASGGLSGSLQTLANGLPYLVGGTGIKINTRSNGQVVVNQITSSQAVNYGFASSTFEQVVTSSTYRSLNLSTSISTEGYPVLIMVNSNFRASPSASAQFTLFDNGVQVHPSALASVGPVSSASTYYDTSIAYVHYPQAGTHTYSLAGKVSAGVGSINVNTVSTIMVWELREVNHVTASSTTPTPVLLTHTPLTGMSAVLNVGKNPVLLMGTVNYTAATQGNWSGLTVFRDGVRIEDTLFPDVEVQAPQGVIGQQTVPAPFAILDYGVTLSGSRQPHTYSLAARDGGGFGGLGSSYNSSGTVGTLIALELPSTNFRYIMSRSVFLGGTFANIAPARTISTLGAPVLAIANINNNVTGTAIGGAAYTLSRDGSSLVTSSFGFQAVDGEGQHEGVPPNFIQPNRPATLWSLDLVGSGTYSYSVQGKNRFGNNIPSQHGATSLFVFELGHESPSDWTNDLGRLKTTSSVSISGDDNLYANQKGTDVFFYVSGTIKEPHVLRKRIALFGGDVYVSGTLIISSGLSGSLTQLNDGKSYLVAGSNITITSQSNGQIVIASTASGSSGGGGSSDANASYVLVSTTGSFPNARQIIAGAGISILDQGPSAGIVISSTPSGSSANDWVTACDINFSLLAVLTAANGANSIGGYSWIGENIASAADFAGVAPGDGLRIDPNSTASDNYLTTRTAPILKLPLNRVIPNFNVSDHEIRVWAQWDVANSDANFEIALTALEKTDWTSNRNFSFRSSKGFNSAYSPTVFRNAQFLWNSSDFNVGDLSGSSGSNNLTVFHLRDLRNCSFFTGRVTSSYATVNSLALPNVSSLTYVGQVNTPGSMFDTNIISGSGDLSFVWSVFPVNTNNSFSASLQRLRIEYRKAVAILDSRWETVYDTRFDTLTTGSYGSNGNITINGATWSVSNYASAKSIGIIPGTGLIFGCNTTNSEYGYGNNRSGPLLATTARNLWSSFALSSHRVRAWALLNPDNAANNFEGAFLGLEHSGGLGTVQTYTQKRAFVSGIGVAAASQMMYSGSNVLNSRPEPDGANHNVLMLQWLNERHVQYWTGISSDGINWPSETTLRLRGSLLFAANSATDYGATISSVNASWWQPPISGSGELGFAIGAVTNNTLGLFTASFRRFRMDVSAL